MLYKLGAVSYLNTLPLIHYLKERPVLAPPAALARFLRVGDVDIATVPIVAYFENPHYTLIPGICIGSHGPVQSVKLFFNSPDIHIHNVKTIYLDMESKTSIMLLKVLLQFKFRRNLGEITFYHGYHPLPSREVEAKLLIGDKAMKEIPISPPLDLGEEWTAWTGLPFVYAAWVSRRPEVSERAIAELTEARDSGIRNLRSVIPTDLSFPYPMVEDYLKNLNYVLGPGETEGMMLFRDYLHRAGWIAPIVETDIKRHAIR